MLLRALPGTSPRARTGIFAVLLTAAAALALSACENSGSSIGSGLLNSVTGEETHRDTLTFSLANPDAIEYATFQMNVSTASSLVMLIGELNNMRSTIMLRFPKAGVETELSEVYDGKAWQTDTLTITPTSIAEDSSAYMLLTISSYASIPEEMYLQGWVVPNDWDPAAPVTTEIPASYFTGTPAFYGDTLSAVANDSGTVRPITFIELEPATINSVLDTTLSIAIRAISPTTMGQVLSLESDSYGPQLSLWLNATVESSYYDTVVDSVIGRNFIVSRDTYRLERLGAEPQPAPGSMLVSSGDIRRGYLKFNRFDVWGANSDSTIPKTLSANKAVLELTLADQGASFQQDSTLLELLELADPFELDSAEVGKSVFVSNRFNFTRYFNTVESRDTTDANIRRFEISDVVNRWWQTPEENHGLMITTGIEARSGYEMRRVDAAEIVGARLIITSTKPPILQSSKPAAAREASR